MVAAHGTRVDELEGMQSETLKELAVKSAEIARLEDEASSQCAAHSREVEALQAQLDEESRGHAETHAALAREKQKAAEPVPKVVEGRVREKRKKKKKEVNLAHDGRPEPGISGRRRWVAFLLFPWQEEERERSLSDLAHIWRGAPRAP